MVSFWPARSFCASLSGRRRIPSWIMTSPSPMPFLVSHELIRNHAQNCPNKKGMESWWFILIVTLCVSAFLKNLYDLILSRPTSNYKNKEQETNLLPLPPGPPALPLIASLLWMPKSLRDLHPLLRNLRAKYGPLISISIGHRPAILVGSHSLAQRVLIQNGAIFSDRPEAPPTARIFNINSAAYGPTWRLLRRNLTSGILYPSRVRSYSHARQWVFGILLRRLLNQDQQLTVIDHFRYAMFCLLVLMCLGDKLEERQINEIETTIKRVMLSIGQIDSLNFWGSAGKFLFRKRWEQALQAHRDQEKVLIPLIRARIEEKKRRQREAADDQQEEPVAYVDTLVDLELPGEKRKLNEREMMTLCAEFMIAGTDTTSNSLQWIMANLVKYPAIQAKLYQEIVDVVGLPPPLTSWSAAKEVEAVDEVYIKRMPYLKAVVLEGLRRHPPGHWLLPHAVTQEVELGGYKVPKNGTVNFMVAEIGWDPEVWEDPMKFNPERFLEMSGRELNDGLLFDVTCSREIKMMPFGAGRRICPGSGLALLHLEYLVANLIWYLEWGKIDGDDVDLSEKQEFTVVMKNPLRAHISPRVKSI